MFRNNKGHTISHYKNVMARYEEKDGNKLSDTKLGKYFNSLSVKEQKKLLKKMNKE